MNKHLLEVQNRNIHFLTSLQEKNGWLQEDLAKKLGVSQPYIAKLKNPNRFDNRVVSSFECLEKIAKVAEIHTYIYVKMLQTGAMTENDYPDWFKAFYHRFPKLKANVQYKLKNLLEKRSVDELNKIFERLFKVLEAVDENKK